jgi:transcriptional regulator with XRE-family HTH domain
MKAIADYLDDAGMSVEDLVDRSGLDKRTVRSIVAGQYTPSPAQRQRLAQALGVAKEDIAWGHTVPVQHLRGNGPQFGRST